MSQFPYKEAEIMARQTAEAAAWAYAIDDAKREAAKRRERKALERAQRGWQRPRRRQGAQVECPTPYYDPCVIPARGSRKPSLDEYDKRWPRHESDSGRRGRHVPLGHVCH